MAKIGLLDSIRRIFIFNELIGFLLLGLLFIGISMKFPSTMMLILCVGATVSLCLHVIRLFELFVRRFRKGFKKILLSCIKVMILSLATASFVIATIMMLLSKGNLIHITVWPILAVFLASFVLNILGGLVKIIESFTVKYRTWTEISLEILAYIAALGACICAIWNLNITGFAFMASGFIFCATLIFKASKATLVYQDNLETKSSTIKPLISASTSPVLTLKRVPPPAGSSPTDSPPMSSPSSGSDSEEDDPGTTPLLEK